MRVEGSGFRVQVRTLLVVVLVVLLLPPDFEEDEDDDEDEDEELRTRTLNFPCYPAPEGSPPGVKSYASLWRR